VEQDGALQYEPTDSNQFFLKGRGELHLGIVLENMRREGYEFQTTSPTVIFRETADGLKTEPYE
jgi:GTP-binding protein